VPHRRGLSQGWYGWRQPIVLGQNIVIEPRAWGYTGGTPWIGFGRGSYVTLAVPEILTIWSTFNEHELALAEAIYDRVDPCAADFVEDVYQTHYELSQRVETYSRSTSFQAGGSSQIVEQISSTSSAAVQELGALSGRELGRAFVYDELARAQQALDLIDVGFGAAFQDRDLGPLVGQLRAAYLERIEVAQEVAQACGYEAIQLE
jgi:hypothetical protein